ncbi:hypothetical protein FHS31_000776 [Sphingomonas vulcanisoli]|uniref:DUF2490 domain-containing protein n=1 Tax=Sphingomonas vulcanisoli TaxID=1658060 RepID=A0ABX0TTT5_9SPHN|nr:DUF2490 domain-containing protein [Sphingomonas vulcanisoli]NIJ07180.1 hypothetical protein [Sphingomonas vulcanisoli]
MRKILFAAAALCSATAASAETTQDGQLWGNVTLMSSFGKRGLYFLEAQPRFADGATRLSQLLLRGGIGLQVTDNLGVYAGYLHMLVPVAGGRDNNEERPFIQLMWQMGEVAGGKLSTRTRIEHRSFSRRPGDVVRVRSMIRWSHALTEGKTPRALLWAEPFVALNSQFWSAPAGLDQLRSFVGLELPLAGKSTLEAGYMNQALNDRGPNNRMNHIASFTLFIRP